MCGACTSFIDSHFIQAKMFGTEQLSNDDNKIWVHNMAVDGTNHSLKCVKVDAIQIIIITARLIYLTVKNLNESISGD